MPFLRERSDGAVLLAVHVQPRAAKNELAGLHDGALKLRLTAPPVEGKANKAVVGFLADLLQLPKSALSIASGSKNRRKQILVRDLSPAEVRCRLGLS